MLYRFIPALLLSALLSEPVILFSQPYEDSPIRYSRRRATGAIADWEHAIRKGDARFEAQGSRQTLDAVLERLNVSPESQVLVYSHTSFQNSHISPETPRALFFNENHYVGWVQGGDIELATVDAKLGLAFYQIKPPDPEDRYLSQPRFLRNPDCLFCHAGSETTLYPGLVAHSVFATNTGSQILRNQSYNVDHRTPLELRWGGWYVTGQVDGPRHRGNVLYSPNEMEAAHITEHDTDYGANLSTLEKVVDMTPYPVPTSDVAALLVLEHQILAHNRLVETFSETRKALWDDSGYMVGRPCKDETIARIDHFVDRLIEAFLFKDEASLSDFDIQPGTGFIEAFQANARADESGRSLKQFDLNDRIFRYRCSYMVYSNSFSWLPKQAKDRFFTKLKAILTAPSSDGTYSYLPAAEKTAIYEILGATHPAIPDYW